MHAIPICVHVMCPAGTNINEATRAVMAAMSPGVGREFDMMRVSSIHVLFDDPAPPLTILFDDKPTVSLPDVGIVDHD